MVGIAPSFSTARVCIFRAWNGRRCNVTAACGLPSQDAKNNTLIARVPTVSIRRRVDLKVILKRGSSNRITGWRWKNKNTNHQWNHCEFIFILLLHPTVILRVRILMRISNETQTANHVLVRKSVSDTYSTKSPNFWYVLNDPRDDSFITFISTTSKQVKTPRLCRWGDGRQTNNKQLIS